MTTRQLFIAALALLAAGCAAVGPDYRKEPPPVPARFSGLEADLARGDPVPEEVLDSWWHLFDDPLLDSLMARLVSRNLDLQVASARLMQARAQLGIAASADLNASEEGLRDTLVSLRGELARNYIDLRGLQSRIDIARREVLTRRDNVDITRERAQAGLTSELDHARASGELASAQARIPELERSLKAALHRIGVLLGHEPAGLESELAAAAVLPAAPRDLPVGLPSDLLRRRPDIRRAERELAAATARIGVSTADFFPRFYLTGAFGYQSSEGSSLFQDASNFWAYGPTIRWPIVNFRRILAQIEASRAVRREVLARYEQSVLLALEEVENALVALSREKDRSRSLAEAVQANKLAVNLAMDRYLAGVESYLAVTDAEAALYAAEDQSARNRQAQALALVALYKALGGGWSATELSRAEAAGKSGGG